MVNVKKRALLSRLVGFNNVMKNIWLLIGLFVVIYLGIMDGKIFLNWIDGYLLVLGPFVISLFHFILLILGEDEEDFNNQNMFHCGKFPEQQDLGLRAGDSLNSIEVGKPFNEKSLCPKLMARIKAFDKHRDN